MYRRKDERKTWINLREDLHKFLTLNLTVKRISFCISTSFPAFRSTKSYHLETFINLFKIIVAYTWVISLCFVHCIWYSGDTRGYIELLLWQCLFKCFKRIMRCRWDVSRGFLLPKERWYFIYLFIYWFIVFWAKDFLVYMFVVGIIELGASWASILCIRNETCMFSLSFKVEGS